MAAKVARKGGWQIKWRKGRAGEWQTEFFPDQYDADVFKLDVERAGNSWPAGWVPGRGYVSAEEAAAGEQQSSNCTLFLPYATTRIERLFAAKRIGADMYRKYTGYAKAFAEAVPVALALADLLADDDALRLQVLEDPSRGAHLLRSLPRGGSDLCIEDVDRDLVAAWVTYRRVNGDLPKTTRNHHGFLHGVFDQAADDGLLARNPCAKTELQKAEPGREKVALERPEFFVCLDSMKPDMQPFMETAVGTAMRFGELTAMTKGAWHPEQQMILVEEAWKRALVGHKIGKPKTNAGIRQVFVGDRVSEIIERQVAGKQDHELVFTAPRGGRIRQNVFGEDRWKPAMHKAVEAGLDPTRVPRFHDLRHTCITWLRDAGLTNDQIKDLVGHSEGSMTAKYGSITQYTISRATAAVDESLSRA